MARPKNADKDKESLENLGVKVEPALKRAIEDESRALGITPGTYSRQLVILGWQSRHHAPIAKNPREQILLGWFNELPIGEQENVLAMVEALHKKHVEQNAISTRKERSESSMPKITRSGTKPRDEIDEAIDAALGFYGEPVSEKDRETIRKIWEKQQKEKEQNEG